MERPLGFIPTMGALHTGHLRLVRTARADCQRVLSSIFVNPLQFGASEDFERYPRQMEEDIDVLKRSGVDVLFTPDAESMFPPDFSTFVDVGSIATSFEGAARPNHFRGVATIVMKLLGIVAPDALYLGQKDAQQTAVVRKLVRDLNVPVSIRIVGTVRESDGLAFSSRNVYLNEEDRCAAPSLYRALQEVHAKLLNGHPREAALQGGRVALSPHAALEYMELVDGDTFRVLPEMRPPAFIIGAARFGNTRLIDNIWISQ
ncbi:MAG: pantoate--beta-alanine ligase [Candidatus Eremiobacteraeota bacterium]|nr:pantoate--beta-alanine ligase [Candidatus Eremiobacteraeota bacterium]